MVALRLPPFLQSFGGDLIDRDTMLSADGALNGPDAVKWGTWFQDLFTKGYANSGGTVGNQEFVDGKVALSYTGVWNGLAAVDAVGDDLLILRRRTSATAPRSAAARGNGASRPRAAIPRVRASTWSSASTTNTSPSSPTSSW